MKLPNSQAGLFCLNQGWKFFEQDYTTLPSGKQHDEVYSAAKGGAAKGPALAMFDDSEWADVTLPHDWVTGHDFDETAIVNHGYKKRGTAWYRNKFKLDSDDRNKQILIEFEGMSCNAYIYFNGMLLYRNFSGYNSFSVDLTDMCNFGDAANTLAVRIDASGFEGWWYEGAGIYRNVWLIKKPPVHIAHNGVFVKPVKASDSGWDTEISVEVENSFEFDRDFRVTCEISETGGSYTVSGSVKAYGTSVITLSIPVNAPQLWDIDTPKLYSLRASVLCEDGEDFSVIKYGYREIHADAETGFWLNGKNIKFKGFCNHQDHAGVGVAVPYAIKEYRIRLLKDLGANAYRLAHNTEPEIIEICDRLGMLVMDENRTFSSAADNIERVKNMVKASRNHPSVVLYSVFNEEPLQGTPKGRRICGRLRAAIREIDDTRPVTGAFNGGYMEADGASTILDMTGINYSQTMYDEYHKAYPDKPMFGSETVSAFMVRGEYETDYGRHVIADNDSVKASWGGYIRDTWRSVNERPFAAGSFAWTGFDYRGEPTPFEFPSVATFFGTYDSCGFDKEACWFYRAFFKSEPVVHIADKWTCGKPEGTPVNVLVINNCDRIELFLNGRKIAGSASDKYDMVSFSVPYERGELKAVGYINGAEAAQDTVLTASEPYRLAIFTSKDSAEFTGHDAVAFNVKAVDRNGTVVPYADAEVRFEVTGGGKIIGVGNGNPNSHEPDAAGFRKLFHGYAQAVVKCVSPENIKFRASAEGMLSAELVLPVKAADFVPYIKPAVEFVMSGWTVYHELFDEMPDPNPAVAKSDMNSFEPIEFGRHCQPMFSGQNGRYALYRTAAQFKDGEARRIKTDKVTGKAWLYIGGVLAAETENGPLEAEINGAQTVTVIVKSLGDEAGICAPFICRSN